MLLVIDAGNTNTVFAIFKEKEIIGQWRISANAKRTSDEYILILSQLLAIENIDISDIQAVVISNVVPQSSFAFKQLSRHYLKCEPLIVGENTTQTGINIAIDRPSEVGADRLVNALAAIKRFDGNVIIIDFGTATTFDIIDAQKNYIGGIIAPGINLSMQALHAAAAKLPEVAIEKPKKVIGTSTITAMQSGIYWGYVGLIEGLIQRIKDEHNAPMKVVATGGLAPLFFKASDTIEHLESDLTIYGLQHIFEINQ